MGTTGGGFGSALFAYDLEPDTADASMNSLYLYQAGLGMPNRDYYLEASFKPQRDAYRAYIERTFKAIGQPDPAAAADRVMAFETAIAKVSWASADRRDIDKTNNPMSSAELAQICARPRLERLLRGRQDPGAEADDRQREQRDQADRRALRARRRSSTLKEWEAFHTADQASPYLNKAMVDSRFDFVKTLSGVSEQRPRWKRSLSLVDGSLGELIGTGLCREIFPGLRRRRRWSSWSPI